MAWGASALFLRSLAPNGDEDEPDDWVPIVMPGAIDQYILINPLGVVPQEPPPPIVAFPNGVATFNYSGLLMQGPVVRWDNTTEVMRRSAGDPERGGGVEVKPGLGLKWHVFISPPTPEVGI